jgi:hypothetical protein
LAKKLSPKKEGKKKKELGEVFLLKGASKKK